MLLFLQPLRQTFPVVKKFAFSTLRNSKYMKVSQNKPNGTLRTMKLSEEVMSKIVNPEMRIIEELFKKNGYEIRIAGGAVRDLLMGIQPHDFDFASTATPEQMKTMFDEEGIRMINANGEKHGTITARVNDKENFEVTTLRIDLVTDGRRAEVEFTTDWQLDANRRDLTINSLFLTFDGVVHDFFKGIEHIEQRKVLFVGDPQRRIQEDYLRILRYFRFYGRIALDAKSHDAATLEAIRLNTEGLEIVSGERLLSEFVKILQGPFACDLVCLMVELGVTPYLGIPSQPNVEEFRKICANNATLHPMAMLCALLKDEEELMNMHSRLKLCNYDKGLLSFIIMNRDAFLKETDRMRFCQHLQFSRIIRATSKELRSWTHELIKYHGDDVLLHEFGRWNKPRLPLNGRTLADAGVKSGPQMGWIQHQLLEKWLDSDFKLSEEELLAQIPGLLENNANKFRT